MSKYTNRELSWLEFNSRVLDESMSSDTPLLERLKFMDIFSSNLDEFYMVRVSGLQKMEEEGLSSSDSPDATETTHLLDDLDQRTRQLVEAQVQNLRKKILPALTENQIRIRPIQKLTSQQQKFLRRYFSESILPLLTPQTFDASHPFPFLANLSPYLMLIPEVQSDKGSRMCFIEIPTILPRLIRVPEDSGKFDFVAVDELITANLDDLFFGIDFKSSHMVRVTRNLDYDLLENEVVDLLRAVKAEVAVQKRHEAVRLEVDSKIPREALDTILQTIHLEPRHVFETDRLLMLRTLGMLSSLNLPEHKFPKFNPRLPRPLGELDDLFEIITRRDLMVHYPYESFYVFSEFLKLTARDPKVLSIKLTLYRAGGDHLIVDALKEAVNSGKSVTAVVELKARFDEKNNIAWARELEAAGVNVVFGFVNLKTHCKCVLVTRREADNKLQQYAHLSTGNFNPGTARLYTDIGFFTKNPQICEGVMTLFNFITGYNLHNTSEESVPRNVPWFGPLAVAPINLRDTLETLIDEEIALCKQKKGGRIIAKMNALVDRRLIDKLYEASKAGVKIDLIVRGICCLKPGVKGLSENITVTSIIDRFLEHSRIFHFHAGGVRRVYLSSADWMPRNMDRRIELMFPIESEELKTRIVDEILGIYLQDNVKSRRVLADGSYEWKGPKGPKDSDQAIRSQSRFIDIAREAGIKSIPYDKAVRFDPTEHKGRPVQKRRKEKKRGRV